MTSQGERIGAALAKAVKGTTAAMKGKDPVMYITNLKDVPRVEGLKRDDGWVDMQVQFLIDKKSAGADHVVGERQDNPAGITVVGDLVAGAVAERAPHVGARGRIGAQAVGVRPVTAVGIVRDRRIETATENPPHAPALHRSDALGRGGFGLEQPQQQVSLPPRRVE